MRLIPWYGVVPIFIASYGRVVGIVNRLRLRRMPELVKTKRNGIVCDLTCNGPETIRRPINDRSDNLLERYWQG